MSAEQGFWRHVHFGRSFVGHPLEDDCSCGKAPCGLVDSDRIDPNCDQHAMSAFKTIRQSYPADSCSLCADSAGEEE